MSTVFAPLSRFRPNTSAAFIARQNCSHRNTLIPNGLAGVIASTSFGIAIALKTSRRHDASGPFHMTPESWQDVFFTETNLDFLPHDMKKGKRNDQRKAICAYVGLCLTTTLGYWQDLDSEYVAPVHPVPRGEAPGMKVQLLKRGMENKEYAVIFAKGDEAFSGLQEFAGKYQIQSAHFTAIGALKGATLAWFDHSC